MWISKWIFLLIALILFIPAFTSSFVLNERPGIQEKRGRYIASVPTVKPPSPSSDTKEPITSKPSDEGDWVWWEGITVEKASAYAGLLSFFIQIFIVTPKHLESR